MQVDAKTVFKFKKFAKKSTRPVLEYIKIEKNAMIATDSFKLLRVKVETDVEKEQLLNVPRFCDKFKKTSGKVDVETKTDKDEKTDSYPLNYPDFEQIMPKDDAKMTVHANAKLLIECLEQFIGKDCGIGSVNIEFRDGASSPIRIVGTAEENKNIETILMPLKK